MANTIGPSASASLELTDLAVLKVFGMMQQVCLLVATSSAAMVLCGWVSEPIGRLLPSVFTHVQPNGAALAFLSGLGLWLTQPQRSRASVVTSRILGFIIALFATVTLLTDFAILDLPLARLIPSPDYRGGISPEASTAFLLLGLVLTNLRARRSLLSHLLDGATFAIILLVLAALARYVFTVSHLLGNTAHDRPLTLATFLSLAAFTFVVTTRRAEYGFFCILIDSGIGGTTARLASPFALVLPFVFALAKEVSIHLNLVLESSAAAVTTAFVSVLAFSLVLAFSRHANQLQTAVHELSLRDELTRLYNRRGFYVLGEQGLRLARRAHQPFFVLFVDVDNLKVVNDSLGHELGSALLQEMGELLESTFRELDVVARLGGDEFVVAGNAALTDISAAVTRLEAAAWRANDARSRPYHLSYSVGIAMSGPRCAESLDTLLERADKTMYDAKRARKQLGAALPVLTCV